MLTASHTWIFQEQASTTEPSSSTTWHAILLLAHEHLANRFSRQRDLKPLRGKRVCGFTKLTSCTPCTGSCFQAHISQTSEQGGVPACSIIVRSLKQQRREGLDPSKMLASRQQVSQKIRISGICQCLRGYNDEICLRRLFHAELFRRYDLDASRVTLTTCGSLIT